MNNYLTIFLLATITFLSIEALLHLLINKIRDRFAERVNWTKGRIFTNIITTKDKNPPIDKKGLYRFRIHFYDSLLGSVTKPASSNIEHHETPKREVVTTRYTINAIGSRTNPGHEHLPTKISCFGDSITFCRHVNDDQSWEHFLANSLGCNVANFAVGNYGLDQAHLRCKREMENGLDGSVVLMGVAPETIRRCLSIWKHFFEFGNIYYFKPRFKLDNGELTLIPTPIDTSDKYFEIEKYLGYIQEHDFFYENKFKKYLLQFPYTYSLLKNSRRNSTLCFFYGMTYLSELLETDWVTRNVFPRMGKTVKGISDIGGLYFDFQDKVKYYDDEHIVGLAASVVREFSECVRKHDKVPYLVVLPTRTDVSYMKDTNHVYYQSLIDAIEKYITVLDVGRDLVTVEDIDSIFADTGYGAHYNETGNRIVAKSISQFLRTEEQDHLLSGPAERTSSGQS